MIHNYTFHTEKIWFNKHIIIIIIIIKVFCPRSGPSLQTQEPRLQFYLRQVFHHNLRKQGCSSAEGRSSNTNSKTKAAILPGMNRCGSFPLLSAPHSLSSIWTDLERSQNILGEPTWRVMRVDLVNWALRTSPKFTTGVKYQFHQDFWPDQRSGNPNEICYRSEY